MKRNYGTDSKGENFIEKTKFQIWSKATIMKDTDSSLIRKDICGAIIHWDKYGDTTENGFGWEIDHIKPVSKGGTDDFSNLQPLQWQNNRAKSDNFPASNFCVVISITKK